MKDNVKSGIPLNLIQQSIFKQILTLVGYLLKAMNRAYISLYFRKNSRTRFIDNCVHLFDNIEIRFVIRVFNAGSSPWNIR